MSAAAKANAMAREGELLAKLADLKSKVHSVESELTALRSFLAALDHFERSAAPAPGLIGVARPAETKRPRNNPSRDEVVSMVMEIIEAAGAPIQRQPLFDALVAKGVVIRGKDPTLVLATMLWRSQDKIVKLHGRGYWIASRPYPPASYSPSELAG